MDMDIVKRFLDEEGRIKQLPAKEAPRREVLEYLAGKFEAGRDYKEKEVNTIISAWHTFGDYFVLRREMADRGLICRTRDGARYWREKGLSEYSHGENNFKDTSIPGLTKKTEELINSLFKPENRKDAADLLRLECSNNLPFYKDSTPQSLERVRFAAIKLSGGRLNELYKAVKLAKTDWRDLLIGADFGSDIKAHEIWADNILQK